MTGPIVWTVLSVARVVDGDTVLLTRQHVVGEADGLTLIARDTKPVRVRLVHVDTPERGEDGYVTARDDLTAWVADFLDDGDAVGLTLRDAGVDPFGRRLGDLTAIDGDTASLHLIRDKGWPTWAETR